MRFCTYSAYITYITYYSFGPGLTTGANRMGILGEAKYLFPEDLEYIYTIFAYSLQNVYLCRMKKTETETNREHDTTWTGK